MKEFFKMIFASFTSLIIFTIFSIILTFAIIGALVSSGDSTPKQPVEAVLTLDMSTITLCEQTMETDVLSALSGNSTYQLGIYDAITAVYAAASDPAIKFIFMKPDAVSGGFAQIEELRSALENFRDSGKPVISYIENPTNGGYYLASVSDKIFMTPYDGGMNMFTGLSSQMFFLKDALDRLGVNVQLIRHGKYKSAGEMFVRNSSSPENLQQNQEMIDSMWDSWAESISSSRELDKAKLNELLNSLELVFPSDFLENGLVDELLSREKLQEKLAVLYMTDDYDDINSISLQEYAQITSSGNDRSSDKVAVIYVNGEIIDGVSNDKQVEGNRFAEIIEDVRCDKSVKAVVLRVNSPGGSVLASEKIKAEIDLLRERVPVIASYGDYAASGGYWISSSCDYIFANSTTLTGSIGVFSMIPDFSKTINNKLHVNITPVNSNDHSDMYGLMRPMTEAEVGYMQASVESIYSKFTNIVAQGRKMSLNDVESIAQGRVWTGAEGLEKGLVDEIGSIDDAILYAALCIEGVESISDIRIVEYPKPKTMVELLSESISGIEAAFPENPFGSIGKTFMNWDDSQIGKVYARIPYVVDIR